MWKNADSFNLSDKSYYIQLCRLLETIKKDGLKAGDRLPPESELADRLFTNRSSLREILRVLETLGIIQSMRGSGNIYIGNMEQGFTNLLLIFSMLDPESKGPLEFCDIRAVIEANAVEQFILRATDIDMFKLQLLYEDYLGTNPDRSSQEYLENHFRFHEHLMKYYPNITAHNLVRSNIRLTQLSENGISYEELPKYGEAEECSHRKILCAVQERNIPLAKRLIIQHVMIPAQQDGS